MILSCNSCEKKFVVPEQAITSNGRVVQCGSCGNKWKQFPIDLDVKDENIEKKIEVKKTAVISKKLKPKKKKIKKSKELNLYSPEYLKKKHGITLREDAKRSLIIDKVPFGFYNYFILFSVIIITITKGLYFFQAFLIEKIPFTEFYINYFFESIRNTFEIWKSLISSI